MTLRWGGGGGWSGDIPKFQQRFEAESIADITVRETEQYMGGVSKQLLQLGL